MSRSFPLFSWGLGPGACAAIRVLLLLSRVPWFPSSPVSRVPFPVGLVADGWCLWAMLGMRPRSRSGRGGEASQASNTTAGAKDSCPDVRRPRRNRPHAAAAAVGDPEQRPNRGERPRRSATAGAETLGLGMLGFDWRGTGQTKIIVPAGKGTILGGGDLQRVFSLSRPQIDDLTIFFPFRTSMEPHVFRLNMRMNTALAVLG